MDIRRYFGGNTGKSALTDLRSSQGSPEQRRAASSQDSKKVKRGRKAVDTEVLLSDTSDEENPMPRSLRNELQKKRTKKRIVFSSDDDDDFPPSASQARPPKKSEKAPQIKLKPRPVRSPVKRPAVAVVSDEDTEKIEDLDEFVPAPPTKKKRGKTPPGQTKLDLTVLQEKQKDFPKRKAAKVVPELEVVNPIEFFENFGKTTEEIKKETNEQGGSKETKTKSTKKDGKVEIFSPRSSPRKLKHSRPEGTLIGRNIELSQSPSKAQSKTVLSPKKTSRKAECVEIKRTKTTAEPKNRKIEKKEEVIVKARKDKTDEQEKSPIGGAEGRKSRKMKSLESKSLDGGKIREIANTAQKEVSLPWVDKYKPSNLKHLVGQNGDKSPMNKLLGWLRDWAKNHLGEGGKQKKARPPPWLAQNDGTAFKAVMLSGPPGVGKTTCAVMACRELGLQYIEKNASDVRNKKILEAQTSELIGCQQMDAFMEGLTVHKAPKSDALTHVLIMDEVDGMSGNDDRAGIAELIQMIKETRIPIICICNDRQSQKMRSLVNYCFDLRFQRPRVEQIRARLLTIACQESFKVADEQIDEIIEASQHDVRQSIYSLQLLSSGGKGSEVQRKDAAINPFEAARRLLNADTSMWEKQQMFFVDYSIMPLFVEENYPFVQNSKMSASERLTSLKNAANSISLADIIDRTIRTTGAWTLLNEQALFSSVVPTAYMNGYMKGMINFPSWLGKNSTANKRQRLLRQLATHTYLRTLANTSSMILDYIPVLRGHYCHPLLNKENAGVSDVIDMYKEYNLIKDDTESIAELAVWPGMFDPGVAIPTKLKAALTRTLNKEHFMLPYATDAVSKGRKKTTGGGTDLDLKLDEEGNLIDQAGENDLEDFGEESGDDDDDDVTATKKKASATDERGAARGGKSRGGLGAKRGSKDSSGRGRRNKK